MEASIQTSVNSIPNSFPFSLWSLMIMMGGPVDGVQVEIPSTSCMLV